VSLPGSGLPGPVRQLLQGPPVAVGIGERHEPAPRLVVDTLGWPVDHDRTVDENIRFVQVTTPGSACSIAFGKGLTKMAPGSLDNMQMVIADADATHADLVARGIEVSEVDELAWGRFVFFADPDGNGWALQQLPDWSRSAGGEGYDPEA